MSITQPILRTLVDLEFGGVFYVDFTKASLLGMLCLATNQRDFGASTFEQFETTCPVSFGYTEKSVATA